MQFLNQVNNLGNSEEQFPKFTVGWRLADCWPTEGRHKDTLSSTFDTTICACVSHRGVFMLRNYKQQQQAQIYICCSVCQNSHIILPWCFSRLHPKCHLQMKKWRNSQIAFRMLAQKWSMPKLDLYVFLCLWQMHV